MSKERGGGDIAIPRSVRVPPCGPPSFPIILGSLTYPLDKNLSSRRNRHYADATDIVASRAP